MGRRKKVLTESDSLEKRETVSGTPLPTGPITTPTTQSKTTTTDELPVTREKKKPVKLDLSRSYATIIGGKNGAKYEQDGKPFNIKGELIEAD